MMRVLRICHLFDASKKYRTVVNCKTLSTRGQKSAMETYNCDVGFTTGHIQVIIQCEMDRFGRVHGSSRCMNVLQSGICCSKVGYI